MRQCTEDGANIRPREKPILTGLGVTLKLAEVIIQESESLENALRRFKRKVQQEDIIKEIKKHSFYMKPGEKRRTKEALSRKRLRKKQRREADKFRLAARLGAALPRIRPQSGKYVWVVGFTLVGPWDPRPASPDIGMPTLWDIPRSQALRCKLAHPLAFIGAKGSASWNITTGS